MKLLKDTRKLLNLSPMNKAKYIILNRVGPDNLQLILDLEGKEQSQRWKDALSLSYDALAAVLAQNDTP